MKPIRILSIDGGGIRGMIPALILAEIEKRTGQPICKLFDIMAGTSTGGMIALGLTIRGEQADQPKFAATDLVGLYRDEGHKIFDQSLWERLNAFRDNAFDHDNLEELLEAYFGDAELKDALSQVLITAYDIERRATFCFDSELAKKNPAENFLVREAARATSAAPTYFEPTQVGQDVRYTLVDGGVFANNPSMLAYVEAKKLHNQRKFTTTTDDEGPVVLERQLSTADAEASEIDENFIMLSLGTGSSRKAYAFNAAKTWGLVGWVRPIVDILMQGTAETVHYQMKHLLPPRLDQSHRYFRMDTQILAEHGEMSDTSPDMMEALSNYANEIILRQSDALDELCEQLID